MRKKSCGNYNQVKAIITSNNIKIIKETDCEYENMFINVDNDILHRSGNKTLLFEYCKKIVLNNKLHNKKYMVCALVSESGYTRLFTSKDNAHILGELSSIFAKEFMNEPICSYNYDDTSCIEWMEHSVHTSKRIQYLYNNDEWDIGGFVTNLKLFNGLNLDDYLCPVVKL